MSADTRNTITRTRRRINLEQMTIEQLVTRAQTLRLRLLRNPDNSHAFNAWNAVEAEIEKREIAAYKLRSAFLRSRGVV